MIESQFLCQCLQSEGMMTAKKIIGHSQETNGKRTSQEKFGKQSLGVEVLGGSNLRWLGESLV